jgi:hypothetical protein
MNKNALAMYLVDYILYEAEEHDNTVVNTCMILSALEAFESGVGTNGEECEIIIKTLKNE